MLAAWSPWVSDASPRFHTNQLAVIIAKGVKNADGIRAATHTGNNAMRDASVLFQTLRPRLCANDRLQLAHHEGIGMRSRHRADDIKCILHIGDPVAQCLIESILEGARA